MLPFECFVLVWFNGISTTVDYLMPSPFLYIQTVLFPTILFSISTQFSSFWPIDKILSGVTILGQSGPGSDGNKGALCIPQSSSIIGAWPSDCLVSYPGHSLGGFTPLQRWSWCILQPQPIGQLFECVLCTGKLVIQFGGK